MPKGFAVATIDGDSEGTTAQSKVHIFITVMHAEAHEVRFVVSSVSCTLRQRSDLMTKNAVATRANTSHCAPQA